MFVHQKCNLYAVSKTFNGEPEKAEVTVSFDSELERNTKSIEFDITDNTAVIDLEVTAYDRYKARIVLTANKRAKITRKNNALTFRGKCTDMERMGANITNPFFTACGVIKTLEVLAASAKILNCDSDHAKECRNTAELLRQALPNDGEKYPHSDCKQKSIAVFGGKYPFDTIANDDEKLLPALDYFSANEGAYGNMYPVGSGVSMWYSARKSVAFARMKMAGRRSRRKLKTEN